MYSTRTARLCIVLAVLGAMGPCILGLTYNPDTRSWEKDAEGEALEQTVAAEISTNAPSQSEAPADEAAPASPEAETDLTAESDDSSGETGGPTPATGTDPTLEPEGSAEESAEATAALVEQCFVEEGEDFSWAHTKVAKETGTRGTKCTFHLFLENLSDEDLRFIWYEKGDTGAQQNERWDAQSLAAGGTGEIRCSHTKGNDGADTYDLVTKVLAVRAARDCSDLRDDSDPAVVALWEQHAVSIEDPCW